MDDELDLDADFSFDDEGMDFQMELYTMLLS